MYIVGKIIRLTIIANKGGKGKTRQDHLLTVTTFIMWECRVRFYIEHTATYPASTPISI